MKGYYTNKKARKNKKRNWYTSLIPMPKKKNLEKLQKRSGQRNTPINPLLCRKICHPMSRTMFSLWLTYNNNIGTVSNKKNKKNAYTHQPRKYLSSSIKNLMLRIQLFRSKAPSKVLKYCGYYPRNNLPQGAVLSHYPNNCCTSCRHLDCIQYTSQLNNHL